MTATAKTGDWVQIERTVLEAGQRAPDVPEDTAATPLVMRVKGFALQPGTQGDEITIRTIIGRQVTGRLVAVAPEYDHGFGRPVYELICVGAEARQMLHDLKRGDER